MARLRRRGVPRVAFSYALIAWLTLQIGDVVLEPMSAPGWVMRALIVVVVAGFPIALLLAWYFELTPSGIERDTQVADGPRPAVTGLRRYADVAIIAVLLIAVVVLLARQGGLLEEGSDGPPVIGVLPFTELGVVEEEAYFGAGLADTLSYKLGQLRQLIVLAPSSTREFSGPGQDLKKIGALLAATALLEGTVRRAAGSLRVNARLVDVASGQQLWAGSYDRSGTDLFAVQDEIATAVTGALQLVLSPEEAGRVTKTQTTELSAYDAFLLGQSRVATRNGEKLAEGVDYFRQAIQLDPGYALAHAALTEALFLAKVYKRRGLDWQNVAGEARAAADQAQALDPGLGEGYLAQAFAAMGDNEFGEGSTWPGEHIIALLKKAMELSPNNATALKFYSSYVASKQEGLAMLLRAAQLDPRSAIIRLNIGDMYRDLGNLEKALHYYREALRVVPSFALAYRGIIGVHDARGEFDQAARLARAFFREYPDEIWAHITYSDALMMLGAWDEFEQYLADYSRMSETAYAEWGWLVKWRADMRYGLIRNDCGAVIEDIRNYWDPVPAEGEPWQDVTRVAWGETVLNARALCEWIEGRPESALHMLQSGIPNLAGARSNNLRALEFGTEVLFAALLEATGRPAETRQVLTRFLDQTSELPAVGGDGIGFGRFFAFAVLGDTDAALDAFEFALESGYTHNLWALDLLDSDPEFAKTIADPRFIEIMARLEERIRPMRESYLANPELPEGSALP